MTTIDPRLAGNTPELTDAERAALFGCLPPGLQAELAELFWACDTPDDRELIYAELRMWRNQAQQAGRKGLPVFYEN